MKTRTLRLMILILSAVLLVTVTIAIRLDEQGSPSVSGSSSPMLESSPGGSSSVPASSTVSQPETTVPPTTIPTTTVPPTTNSVPPVTAPPTTVGTGSGEYIGTLYTRDQLAAMDTTMQGYGAGKEVDSKNRPTFAQSMDKKYEKYNAHFINPDDGKLYLTFNCTYEHEGLVQKTLDILKDKNVQCVFFVDRYFAKQYPQMIRQILDDGHILANHCTTHPDLPTLSIDKIVSQIMDIHNFVKETYRYEMHLFRPPSGYFSEQVFAIAQSLGYTSYNWSFTHMDYDTDNQPDLDATLAKMTNAIHSGAIYQLHAISSANAAVLGDFIDAVRAKGLEFALLA